jgi:hypothetical protein
MGDPKRSFYGGVQDVHGFLLYRAHARKLEKTWTISPCIVCTICTIAKARVLVFTDIFERMTCLYKIHGILMVPIVHTIFCRVQLVFSVQTSKAPAFRSNDP